MTAFLLILFAFVSSFFKHYYPRITMMLLSSGQKSDLYLFFEKDQKIVEKLKDNFFNLEKSNIRNLLFIWPLGFIIWVVIISMIVLAIKGDFNNENSLINFLFSETGLIISIIVFVLFIFLPSIIQSSEHNKYISAFFNGKKQGL